MPSGPKLPGGSGAAFAGAAVGVGIDRPAVGARGAGRTGAPVVRPEIEPHGAPRGEQYEDEPRSARFAAPRRASVPHGRGWCKYGGEVRPRSSAFVGLVGGVLGLIVLASGSPARADDLVRVKLAYSATDPTCPDPRGFRDLVTSRMGYDPFKDDASGVVTVTIEPAKTKGTLVGSVAMKTRRELLGREGECPELAQALAVALAIVLDPFGEQAAKAKAAPLPEPPPGRPGACSRRRAAGARPAARPAEAGRSCRVARRDRRLRDDPPPASCRSRRSARGARFALGQGMFSGGAGRALPDPRPVT